MRPQDGPALAHLIRVAEDADNAIHRTTSAEVSDMMEGANGANPFETILGFDAENRLVAAGSVRVLRQITTMAIAQVNAFIMPHWRGRGIGRALLAWQDGRSRQLLCQEFGDDSPLPARLMNVVDGHMLDRRRLYIAAGFYAQRTFPVMYRDIAPNEPVVVPRPGYRVTNVTAQDIAEVRATHMKVFEEHFWPEMRGIWWDEAISAFDARWSFIVRSDTGQLVAYILAGRPVERWATRGVPEAYAQLVGVDSRHRGQGLTTALFSSVFHAVSQAHIATLGLDVDAQSTSSAHQIYEHLGFVDQASQVYYAINL